MSFQITTDPSGLYYGSNASGLVNVVADNTHVNNNLSASSICCDNLHVTGETITTTISEVNIDNPILNIANGNDKDDTTLTGVAIEYGTSSGPRYAGLIRSNTGSGEFMFLTGSTKSDMTGPPQFANVGMDTLYSNAIENSNNIKTTALDTYGITLHGQMNVVKPTSSSTDSNTTTVSCDAISTPFISAPVIHASEEVILDDGTGSLFNKEVNTDSLNATGTTQIGTNSHTTEGVLKLYGEFLAYPEIPFGGVVETTVPSLKMDGDGITTVDVAAISFTASASPLDVLPVLATISEYLPFGFPYCQLSGVYGNITAYGGGAIAIPQVIGGYQRGNIRASGGIAGASGSFGTTRISGTLTINASLMDNNQTPPVAQTALSCVGSTVFGTPGAYLNDPAVGSTMQINGAVTMGSNTNNRDIVKIHGPLKCGPLQAGPRSYAYYASQTNVDFLTAADIP